MHLSGYRERNVYGASYVVKQDIAMSDLLFRADHVIRNEIDVTHHQLRRNGVVVIEATATFADANTARPARGHGGQDRRRRGHRDHQITRHSL
jgi:NAD(P) transhydrogenase